jgi:glycerol kinase
MTSSLYLALDQGGHASRALVLDARGNVVVRALVEVATRSPRAEWVEQDADAVVVSLETAVARCHEQLGVRAGDIAAAGLATQRSSIVCWDRASGAALSPVLSWQDRRAAAWLEGLRDHAARVRAITGLVLSPHYGASKLRWCLDNLPEVARAAREQRLALGPLASFLLFRLLSERPVVADPANAARTLLFDLRRLDWDDGLLALFGIPRAALPRCVLSRDDYGTLKLAERSVPLTVATGDQSAALYAGAAPQRDCAYINLGTGAFVQYPTGSELRAAPGLLTGIVFHDGRTPLYTLEGTVNGAGSALAWAAEELQLPDLEAHLSRWLDEQREPPLFLNGIGGLGAPFWVADFPSRFIGKGSSQERAVAVAESIVFLLATNLERMPRASRLIVSGGLARHDGLCRRLADLTGVPVERSRELEATARGLAWLVAGCPAEWSADSARDEFAPAENESLRVRHRRWRAAMDAALGSP